VSPGSRGSGEEANVIRPCGVCGVDGDGEVGDEAETGQRTTKKLGDPVKPKADEVKEHEFTHLPYRSWCRHCVRGRGKEMSHKKVKEHGEMLEFHLDFMFPGDEKEAGNTLTALAMKERHTGMTMATVIPDKSTGRFVTERIGAFLHEVGGLHGDIILKSDQEASAKAVVDAVTRLKAEKGSGRVVPEGSPVASSASDGVVERGIQSVLAQMKSMRSALEEKWGVAKIAAKHPIMAWLTEYAAHLLNRFEVGRDGRTAYERSKMKKATTLGLEIGEGVLWKRKPVGGALGKLTCMWGDGIFLGVKGKTGEVIVGDRAGVWKTRTVQRKPLAERWNAENAELVTGVPWRVSAEDANADGDMLKVVVVAESDLPERNPKDGTLQEEAVPRRVRITKQDLVEHGFTASCPGCVSIMTGSTTMARSHSEACRKRLENAMEGDPRLQKVKRRQTEFLAKAVEAQDEQEKKKRRTEEPSSSRDGMETEVQAPMVPPVVDATVDEARMEVGGLEVNDDVEEGVEWTRYIDEKTGEDLDPKLVKAARKEEMTFMEKIVVFEESTREECFQETGKPPVSTRWVDINKGTAEDPEVRCRMVARDFKPRGERDREDLFAAMPPLECKKLLFAKAVQNDEPCRRGGDERLKLMFIDVKKAHLNAMLKAGESAFVELPGESGAKGKCMRLRRWLYGMRPAAAAWESDYAEKLAEAGFVQGRAAPTVFYCPELQVRAVVHGDDFTFLGFLEDLMKVKTMMESWYEVKLRGILGDEAGDLNEITILNRELRWKGGCIEYEADPKHAREVIRRVGLEENSKGLDGPIVKETLSELAVEAETLDKEESTEFRAIAATANYLAQDRIDIQFGAKEICRDMAVPTKRSQAKLKRLARYLKEYPRFVLKFLKRRREGRQDVIDVYGDSDWAGCLRTRRSTTGGIAAVSGTCVKSWSSTQASVAQSSGEAEYYSLARAAAEGLGIQALMRDLGWDAIVRVWVDSSAAKSIASRVGLGKVRHLEVKFLWIQEMVKGKKIQVRKIRGDSNPADNLTKPKTFRDLDENGKLKTVGARIVKRQVL
jgi:hypothetical protein